MSEGLYEIPADWRWEKMGDIADVVGGGTPNTKDPKNYEGGDIPWLTPADMSGYEGKFVSKGRRMITDQGLNSSSAKMMPAGTVLFSSRAPIGYVAIASNPISTNQGFRSFVLKDEELLPDYVYWWLKGNKALAESYASGTTFLELSGSKAKQLPIPIAPIDQQQRIVAEIEKQFSRLDEAVASLKRVKANLKRYKAAVLKAAVEGKLTEEWRKQNPDVEPASKLLERILVERRTKWEEAELAKMKAKGKEPKNDKWKDKYKEPMPPEPSESLNLLDNWCSSTIGQVVECLDSMRKPINKKERLARVGDIPYYGANGQVGVIDDYLFDEPLVLVVEDETFVGRTQPFSYKISGKTWVNNHAHVLRPTGVIGLDYLNYSLMFYPFIRLTTGTTGRKKLTQKALMSAPYRLPPILEQEQISAAIEERFSVAEKVEEELARSEAQLASMRQAVLVKAFQGALLGEEKHAA